MEIVHNKLVRDKIPEIINAAGKKANYRVLENDQEFLEALKAKLVEEANEAAAAKTYQDLVEELADLELVIANIKILLLTGSGARLSVKKMQEKGDFKRRIFLESVEDIQNE